jgi:hypothetical protein
MSIAAMQLSADALSMGSTACNTHMSRLVVLLLAIFRRHRLRFLALTCISSALHACRPVRPLQ